MEIQSNEVKLYTNISGFAIETGPVKIQLTRNEFKSLLGETLKLVGMPNLETASQQEILSWVKEVEAWVKESK